MTAPREHIAATLAEHWEVGGTSEAFECTCGHGLGDGWGDVEGRHQAHVADALLAAGIGTLPEATEAEEWHPVSRWKWPVPCSTEGCEGDGRYPAPGRGHAQGCAYPLREVDSDGR